MPLSQTFPNREVSESETTEFGITKMDGPRIADADFEVFAGSKDIIRYTGKRNLHVKFNDEIRQVPLSMQYHGKLKVDPETALRAIHKEAVAERYEKILDGEDLPMPDSSYPDLLRDFETRLSAQRAEITKAEMNLKSAKEYARRDDIETELKAVALPPQAIPKLVDAMAVVLQTGEFGDVIHPMNRRCREAFTKLSGVKLPSTVAGTKTALAKWWKSESKNESVDEAGNVVGSFEEADDLDIYPITIGGEQKYAIRDAVNGTPRGGGDPIASTVELAHRAIRDVQMDRDRRALFAKNVADKKAKADADEAERQDIDGFYSNKSALVRGRAVNELNKQVNYGGIGATYKEHVRRLLKEGAKVQEVDGKLAVVKAGGGVPKFPKIVVEYAGYLYGRGVGESVSIEAICEATAIDSKSEPDPLVKTLTQFMAQGNTSKPIGPAKLKSELDRFAYQLGRDMSGAPTFTKIKPKTDDLIWFKNSVMESVLKEVDKFWGLEQKYADVGALYHRGLLLKGPPGSGKSTLVQQLAKMIVERGDPVFFSNDSVGTLIACLKAFREVEPERKIVVILEDMDQYISGYQEREMLQLLDGADNIERCLYIGTTNYPERFPPRLIRPGRFDKVILIPGPNESERFEYLKRKASKTGMSDAALRDVAERTEGMSFGHLREFVVATYALGEPMDAVIDRLRSSPIGMNESVDEAAPIPYAVFKTVAAELTHEMEAASAILHAIPGVGSGTTGLTPDTIKATSEYKNARRALDAAVRALQDFNGKYAKHFSKEIRADISAQRLAKLNARRTEESVDESSDINNPPFLEYRKVSRAGNAGTILPAVGKKFTDEQIKLMVEWLNSLSSKMSVKVTASGINVIDGARETWGGIPDGFSKKRSATSAANRAKIDADNEKRQQERAASIAASPANEWLTKNFGADFANPYNRNALLQYVEGKTDRTDSLMTPEWLDGLHKLGAADEDLRKMSKKEIFDFIKAAYERRANESVDEAEDRSFQSRNIDAKQLANMNPAQKKKFWMRKAAEYRKELDSIERTARMLKQDVATYVKSLPADEQEDYQDWFNRWTYAYRRVADTGKGMLPGGKNESVDESTKVETSEQRIARAEKRFPQRAGLIVDGRKVIGEASNQSSIASSLDDYKILKDVREVPMFGKYAPSYSATEQARTETLKDKIAESKQIIPLIVVIDADDAPYVLEGAHRFDALRLLGAKSFPAMVVVDLSDISEGEMDEAAPSPDELDEAMVTTRRQTGDWHIEFNPNTKDLSIEGPPAPGFWEFKAIDIPKFVKEHSTDKTPPFDDIFLYAELSKMLEQENKKDIQRAKSREAGRARAAVLRDAGLRRNRDGTYENAHGETTRLDKLRELSLDELVKFVDDDLISEMSMARLVHHFQDTNDNDGGILIVSPDRAERTPAENRKLHDKLSQMLRSINLGYAQVRGGFVETDESGDKHEVVEKSFIIPKVTKEQAMKLSKIVCRAPFNQEAVMWADESQGVYLFYGPGKPPRRIGSKMSIGNANQLFAELHNTRFAFESGSDQPAPSMCTRIEYIPFGDPDIEDWREIVIDAAMEK